MSEMLDVTTPEGMADAIMNHGVTPADMHGITPRHLAAVYALAREKLQAGRLDEALDDLVFLVQHAPGEFHHQFAFAWCLHQLGQLEDAGNHYAQALTLEPTDALCVYRMGECLAAMGDLPAAREAFDACVKLSWLEPRYVHVREQAQQRLDQITALGA